MIIIIIIIIIIAFKGAIRHFLQSPQRRKLSPTRTLKWPGRNRVQTRATHRALITCKCHVTCHLVRRDTSATELDRVEIAFI